MDFEDRLRNQLQNQTADIDIAPEGIDVVADRVRTRRTRRTAAAAVAALVVVAGLTAFLVERGSEESDRVATEGVDDEATATTSDDDAEESADGAVASSRAGGADEDDLPDVVRPDPGSSLVFTNIEDDSSPGGYNVWQNGRAGDIYYVLSTAPGTNWEDLEAEGRFRPDTLYTWNGDRWSTGTFGDRFVTEISAGDDGVLYAVSTGSVAGQGLEAGSSADGGATWTWTSIDLSAQFPEAAFGYEARSASDGDRQLVVVHRSAGADWEEAIALAKKSGVDIDQETDEIFNIDTVGIDWVPDAFEVSPCNAAYNEYFDSRYAEDEEEIFEPPFPYDGELTDEQLAELRAWELEQEQLWDQRQLDAIDHMRSVPGCEEFQACMTESHARETELRDLDESQAVFEELERRAAAGEEISDEEWIAAEEASAAIWDVHSTWMEESGCGDILYGSYDEPAAADIRRVTWEELGVIAPPSWGGSTHAYLVQDGSVQPLGPQFAESTGWLVDVRSTTAGFEVMFDDTRYEPLEAGPEEIETRFTTWTSTDGVSWSSSTSSPESYGFEDVALDGSSFSITWLSDEDRSDLIRVNPDGTSDRLLLADMATGVDTTGYLLIGLDSGPYGVVAWASKWDDAPARAIEGDFDYSPDSMILYSPDGKGWGATPLPGTDIADAIVGPDGVMVFLADPDFNGPETPPQPVLLGTAG